MFRIGLRGLRPIRVPECCSGHSVGLHIKLRFLFLLTGHFSPDPFRQRLVFPMGLGDFIKALWGETVDFNNVSGLVAVGNHDVFHLPPLPSGHPRQITLGATQGDVLNIYIHRQQQIFDLGVGSSVR
jgi:hypothetical protein